MVDDIEKKQAAARTSLRQLHELITAVRPGAEAGRGPRMVAIKAAPVIGPLSGAYLVTRMG